MATGPGKYDRQATIARNLTEAKGIALIVLGGKKGDGFSVQAPPEVIVRLPELLEHMAKSIREDLSGG